MLEKSDLRPTFFSHQNKGSANTEKSNLWNYLAAGEQIDYNNQFYVCNILESLVKIDFS